MKNHTVTLSLVLATLVCAVNAAFFVDFAHKFRYHEQEYLMINESIVDSMKGLWVQVNGVFYDAALAFQADFPKSDIFSNSDVFLFPCNGKTP
jgi:hypothetical protein